MRGVSLRQGVLLLLLAVAVPIGCVLWFMSEAMDNERLAARQRLTSVYRGQLEATGRQLQGEQMARQLNLVSVPGDEAAAVVFARLVTAGVADGVIILDESGRIAYPAPVRRPADRLHHVAVTPADILPDFAEYLPVGNPLDVDLPERQAQVLRDLPR